MLGAKSPSIRPVERRRKNIVFSLVVTSIGVLIAALCVVVFLVFLGGDLGFGG
jgi:hypothetical protein